MRKDETLRKERKKYIDERLSRVNPKNKAHEMQLIADDLFLAPITVRKIAENDEY